MSFMRLGKIGKELDALENDLKDSKSSSSTSNIDLINEDDPRKEKEANFIEEEEEEEDTNFYGKNESGFIGNIGSSKNVKGNRKGNRNRNRNVKVNGNVKGNGGPTIKNNQGIDLDFGTTVFKINNYYEAYAKEFFKNFNVSLNSGEKIYTDTTVYSKLKNVFRVEDFNNSKDYFKKQKNTISLLLKGLDNSLWASLNNSIISLSISPKFVLVNNASTNKILSELDRKFKNQYMKPGQDTRLREYILKRFMHEIKQYKYTFRNGQKVSIEKDTYLQEIANMMKEKVDIPTIPNDSIHVNLTNSYRKGSLWMNIQGIPYIKDIEKIIDVNLVKIQAGKITNRRDVFMASKLDFTQEAIRKFNQECTYSSRDNDCAYFLKITMEDGPSLTSPIYNSMNLQFSNLKQYKATDLAKFPLLQNIKKIMTYHNGSLLGEEQAQVIDIQRIEWKNHTALTFPAHSDMGNHKIIFPSFSMTKGRKVRHLWISQVIRHRISKVIRHRISQVIRHRISKVIRHL